MEGNEVVHTVSRDFANVPLSSQGTEASVVGRERWEEIQRLHGLGHTLSHIARHTGLDRKTVRACVRKSEWVAYRREPTGQTLLAPHMAWLAERAAQVHYSARILFQELRAERGYSGGYDTVKNAVRPLRAEAAVASLTQRRFETGPAEQVQVDWGQIRTRFVSGAAEVHVFVMTLGYSRRAYAEGFENERIGSLLAAHEHAFEHFGGRCAELLYDRMRTVVLGTLGDASRWNPTFEAFAKHWGFEPRLCRPYRVQTKGKVERPYRYIRQDFFLGRGFRNLDDLNAQLKAWLDVVANARRHGTTGHIVAEAFEEERASLRPPPALPFRALLGLERRISRDGLVSVAGNLYSVPDCTRRRVVEVHVLAQEVHVFEEGQLIAVHPVLEGRGQCRIAEGHRRTPPPSHSRRPRSGTPLAISRAGEQVARRTLAFYERVGRRLAAREATP